MKQTLENFLLHISVRTKNITSLKLLLINSKTKIITSKNKLNQIGTDKETREPKYSDFD